MLTYDFVENALVKNGFNPTSFTCDDGAEVVITPCFYEDKVERADQCEYFLVDGDLPWMGGSSLEKVVNDLNRHASLVAESEDEKKQLLDFFNQHQVNGWDDDSWSWYSDWHKDVYGYRPHGYVCGEYVRPY